MHMDEQKAKRICRRQGLAVTKGGKCFTVCGGRLLNGQEAPDHIARLNGFCVFEAAMIILRNRAIGK